LQRHSPLPPRILEAALGEVFAALSCESRAAGRQAQIVWTMDGRAWRCCVPLTTAMNVR
jgi:hypothetical protein